MPNIWSWPAWAGPRERSVQWWPPQESAGPGVEQWDIVGGGRILISRLGPLVVELFHCYSWQMFPCVEYSNNFSGTYKRGRPRGTVNLTPWTVRCSGFFGGTSGAPKGGGVRQLLRVGRRRWGEWKLFPFYDLELDWCHNTTQAGSGEESEEEEDDSDGEEGPRGRMCTQS